MSRAETELNSTFNWETAIGMRVRAAMGSPEMNRYFSVKMTPKRARVALLQLSLFGAAAAIAGRT
jgi:hypothetical protein